MALTALTVLHRHRLHRRTIITMYRRRRRRRFILGMEEAGSWGS